MYLLPLQIREAAQELGYQPDEMFQLKISQLRELFAVRWSVFLLGPAGCGKSAIWRTLLRAQNSHGEKSIWRPVNPKVCGAVRPSSVAAGMCVGMQAAGMACIRFTQLAVLGVSAATLQAGCPAWCSSASISH